MIPNLAEVAEHVGVSPAFLLLALAAFITTTLLFVQSVARWFENRNP